MSLTIYIIIATCIVSFVSFSNEQMFRKFLFNAYDIYHKKQWYRFITHAFLHGDIGHLLMNMYVLYLFGSELETVWFPLLFQESGDVFYLILYFGAIVVSSIYSFFKNRDNPSYNAIGASGAVSAILFSSILINPLRGLYIMFIPIAIPGAIFGIAYLIYSWYMGKRNADNVGHDAHFWGAVFGFALTALLRPGLFIRFFQQMADIF